MREKSESRVSYTAVVNSESHASANDGRHSLANNAQQVLVDAQHVLVDILQSRTDSGTEHRKKWVFVTMVCGLCSITLGSLIFGINPYEIVFRMKMIFSDDGETFLMWKKPDVNLYLKVSLFNITNAERYMSGLDPKMKVQEIGPYVYREYLEHANTTFNANHTITSHPTHPLEFQPHLSNGREDDLLYLPNIALLSIAQVMARKTLITRAPINFVITQTNQQPLVLMTAKEFMFGYSSKLLTLGNSFMPSWIDFNKLGLIDRMYNNVGDTSTTFSGEDDLRKTGLLDNYNRRPTLPHWPFPCNNITGASDGTKFNSLLTGNETLVFFRKALCRTVQLSKVGEESVGWLSGYRYEIKNNSFDNGHYEASNRCYCKKGKCMPVGLLDVSDCYYGFPIALSYPHFLDGDPKLVEAFDGIKPEKSKHGSYFIINNIAGIPLKVSVKMQINMALEDISSINNVKRFSNMYLPMLWIEIEMPQLTKSLATRFFIYLYVGPVLYEVIIYVLMTCGVAFILLSLSSSVLIPRLTFDSDRRFSPSGWVPHGPHQQVHNKNTSDRASRPSKETDHSSLLSDNGHNDYVPLKETTSNHFHSS